VKVGFLIDRWEPARGGAERALAAFSRRLVARGAHVVAFAAEGRIGAPGELTELVRVPAGAWGAWGAIGHPGELSELVRVPSRAWNAIGRGARARALARDLPAAARKAGCDLTVGVRHLAEVDLYWPHGGVHQAGLAARREAHGLEPEAPPRGRHRIYVALERALLEGGRARRVVCVSELSRAELESYYPGCRGRTVAIENGVDLERFDPVRNLEAGARLRASLAIGRGTPLVVFAARDPLQKGLGELARALARLRRLPWHLLVAGPRHHSTWERLILRGGLDASRFTLRRQVAPEALFAAADVTAHPTWRDPCPLVVLESLAAGTPVVTTRRAGNAHRVVPSAGTVIEDPRAESALSEALGQWIERALGAPSPREEVRAAVAACGEGPWLDALEAELVGLLPGSTSARA
jgi:glycosyltransferase involved in cell wall biosynthesis